MSGPRRMGETSLVVEDDGCVTITLYAPGTAWDGWEHTFMPCDDCAQMAYAQPLGDCGPLRETLCDGCRDTVGTALETEMGDSTS